MTSAVVFNVQRFSLHDGPGIRTTVFLKGCPLRCTWCHNPESLDPRPEPLLKAERCLGCERCAPACSRELAGPLDPLTAANRPDARCVRCGDCAEACPTGARELVGRTLTAAELVAEVLRDAPYHAETGGGVTFSGGEPLAPANAPFVTACLADLRRRGVHTALDTCGHVPTDTLLDAATLADLVLWDLKLVDDAAHRRHTGVGVGLIHANLRALAARGIPVRVRVPLVPGITDGEDNLAAIGRFVAGLPGRVPVDLLPYHATARDKYARLGRDYPLAGIPAHGVEEMGRKAAVLSGFGLDVNCGG
jgi:pyruvate formate lyase activating enzyme